jgi:hypothetical protein
MRLAFIRSFFAPTRLVLAFLPLAAACSVEPGQSPAGTSQSDAIRGAQCEAYPACDQGDWEVPNSSACLQDDARCYQREICGYSIWCTGGAACPEIAPVCPAGEVPADLDGDGCALECKPVACPPVWPLCSPGEVPADLDGDGCALECKPVACPPVWPLCSPGEVPADLDGDGCALECKPVACPPVAPPDCGPDEKVADTDGDGCALECEPRR